ncbi:MAG: hypothetical protein ACMUIL_12490 [bacterium]
MVIDTVFFVHPCSLGSACAAGITVVAYYSPGRGHPPSRYNKGTDHG